MKGSDDYASRKPRPRPRPSAPPLTSPSSSDSNNNIIKGPSGYKRGQDFEEQEDLEPELDIDSNNDLDDGDHSDQSRDRYSSNIRKTSNSASRNAASRSAPGRNTPSKAGSKGKSKAEKEADKKEKSKKLRTLLSNQAICLVIIFALVAGFNWMAADYSGEYIGQDAQLGLVKLSLVREATFVDGELSYKGTTNLEMQQGNQPKDQQADLTFIAANPKLINRGLITRARFIGSIDSSAAEGAIVDAKGSHNVKLTKNIVASLFKQLQHHTPSVQLPRPPKLFQVPAAAPRAPLPNETDSTRPFTYGGSEKPAK
ncbi:hypothetical protein BH11CYA1_BH11CYA1_03130 [soil metagenome]